MKLTKAERDFFKDFNGVEHAVDPYASFGIYYVSEEKENAHFRNVPDYIPDYGNPSKRTSNNARPSE